MEIRRIDKINLTDEVYQQLRGMITSGTWSEGMKIESENQLALQFSVSRVVVREALQKLRSERFVVTKQGVGTFVANPYNYGPGRLDFNLTEEYYRQFVDFRAAVEVMAARLSVQYATEEDSGRIDAALGEMKKYNELGDNGAYNMADFEFHLAVVQCGHNEFLINAMQANKAMMIQVFNAMNEVPGGKAHGVQSHQELIEKLRTKDINTVLRWYDGMGSYNIARISTFLDGN